mmetsp:Transcript_36878/g.93964  ORF Transcript_36878/g.93964 Transcript_36878/m.93964 type:complete len:206 (-) Transcript_36878:795-1412(-)
MRLQEVVRFADLLAALELPLGLVVVHLRVQSQQEPSDGVAVADGLVVDDPHGVLHDVLQPLVQDQAGADVAEEVWAREGDDGQALLTEEKVQHLSLGVVQSEDGEQCPMQKPRSVQQNLPLRRLGVLQMLVHLHDHLRGLCDSLIARIGGAPEDGCSKGAPDELPVAGLVDSLLPGLLLLPPDAHVQNAVAVSAEEQPLGEVVVR